MCVHGGGLTYTLSEDPRITRTGRWLRWLKVDELPQLFNVLRGEMSLVGPRPVVPELAIEFQEVYSRLLEVRPGLTDPATLKYCREEKILALVADPATYYRAVLTPDKLRISTAYMERANIWSDLGVLVGTALALFPFDWRPRFILAWFSAPGSSPEPIFADPVQRAKAQPSIENI
jgi:lipopolysaccharide/colanic/teichoic acid biosynthesis glycosyltransferase